MLRYKNGSRAARKERRRVRSRNRAEEYYSKHPEQHGNEAIRTRTRRVTSGASQSGIQREAKDETKPEPRIYSEDTKKLGELSGGRLTESKLSILVHAGMHHVRDIVKRMKDETFKVSGIGAKTEQIIKETLREYGVEIL